MSQDINSVVIVGRLTRDSEQKYTSGGYPVLNWSIASNKRRKNGDEWEDEPSFFDCRLFGKYGEVVAPFLVKGAQVIVSGKLHQDRWETNGEKRSKVTIDVTDVQVTRKSGDQSDNRQGPPPDHKDPASPQFKGNFEDDIPWEPRNKSGKKDDRIPF